MIMAHSAIFIAQHGILARFWETGCNRRNITRHDHRTHIGHRNMNTMKNVGASQAESNRRGGRNTDLPGVKPITHRHQRHLDRTIWISFDAKILLSEFLAQMKFGRIDGFEMSRWVNIVGNSGIKNRPQENGDDAKDDIDPFSLQWMNRHESPQWIPPRGRKTPK